MVNALGVEVFPTLNMFCLASAAAMCAKILWSGGADTEHGGSGFDSGRSV